MAEEQQNKGMKVKSHISKKLAGRGNISAYGEKLKELNTVAATMAPEGFLFVSLFERSESFDLLPKLARDLVDLESIYYSHKAIQANPKLADEYREIIESVQTISKIIAKRKKHVHEKRDASRKPKGE